MSLEQMALYYKDRDLDGQEIQTLIGKQPIMYSDLAQYQTLGQLLGKENYVIVMYQTSSKTTGHFVAITRNDTTGKVRYNDPYGIPNPDKELQFTPYDQKLPKYLTKLLQGVDYESNTVDYQGGKKVSDCGRWSSLFCMLRNMTSQQVQRLFKTNGSGFLGNSDNCAVLLTLLSLNDLVKFETSIGSGTGGIVRSTIGSTF